MLGLIKKKNKGNNKDYSPKSDVARGPDGKFVSKKKPITTSDTKVKVETKSKSKKKVKKAEKTASKKGKLKGPVVSPLGGREIRRYYDGETWYFSIEDLFSLISSDSKLKPLEETKKEKNIKDIYDKKTRTIDGEDYADAEGSAEMLTIIIRKHNARFPGSLFRWLDEISAREYMVSKKVVQQVDENQSFNPSDRG